MLASVTGVTVEVDLNLPLLYKYWQVGCWYLKHKLDL